MNNHELFVNLPFKIPILQVASNECNVYTNYNAKEHIVYDKINDDFIHSSNIINFFISLNSSLDLYGKPVAAPFTVFTSKENDVSIGTAPGGIEIATVNWATSSFSRTLTAVWT